jgi:hypothetical protein
LKDPKNTVAPLILKWNMLGTTNTLPRAGRPAKQSNWGRRALVREMVTLTELQSSYVELGEPYRRTTISAAFHQSGIYGRGARWKPLSKRVIKANLEFAKRHLKIVRNINKILKIEFFGLNASRLENLVP